MASRFYNSTAIAAVWALAASSAGAATFNVPGGSLEAALDAYSQQSGVQLVIPNDQLKGVRSSGVRGDLAAPDALSRILSGTGFTTERDASGLVGIVRDRRSQYEIVPLQLAQASPAPRAAVETVTVTSSKLGGADVQSIPIAITALSQEQLTATQTAGGPDLVKQVPNLTFTKTNFTGYSIQIRGIGTQAISVTTDPAVAVSFNDIPFIRNHFFEQEFFDVSQVEVLRGPQGTLYGRNATAGVVNVISARPTDQFEGMVSADIGNYKNRRFEAMLNLPFVSDKLDLRVAGEWTKRNGYSTNEITGNPIDGRDLWSGRASLRWKPVENVTADFIWEHFQEDDDRLRSGKQLCKRGNGLDQVLGVSTAVGPQGIVGEQVLNQGCYPVSLYSPEAFGVPNAQMLPYYGGLIGAAFGLSIESPLSNHPPTYDPYASTTQSQDLRVIESTIDPHYRSKNDTLELNAEWNITPSLTFHSDTGYNRDFLSSSEDFNRFNTVPGTFAYTSSFAPGYFREITPENNYVCQDGSLSIGAVCGASTYKDNQGVPQDGLQTGIYCDPQLGCADRLVAEDLSEEHAWQFNQEFRLASNLTGPFNFSVGGNYLHYETEENYYVFINSLSVYMQDNNEIDPARSDIGVECLKSYAYPDLSQPSLLDFCTGGYMDPNPIGQLNNKGHNYFLSQNPYVLNSYAGFGEAYYDVTKELKLTAGLRWTDDEKHFTDIPSELLVGGPGGGFGYPSVGTVDQEWKKWTGRFVATWTPKLDFTDQSMVYASYSHGYKAGGANPPGAQLIGGTIGVGNISSPVHPLTFEPEFIDAYEIGTKNTALDGALTFNTDGFYYNYKGYQISQIVDRTSINLNFDATVWGGEVTATWEPVPGLKFGISGGYENTSLANGSKAIDLMDRTAGNPNWILVKPNVTQPSNCVLPAYVVATMLSNANLVQGYLPSACGVAYNLHQDPVTQAAYGTTTSPYAPTYTGFDPLAGTAGDPYSGQNIFNGIDYGPAPNNGEGFYKDLSGNELPNAPKFTVSLTGDYSVPLSSDWAATLHSDFYWQSQSWARVFNAVNDRLHGYTNVNLALILTDTSGWQVMGYVKNIFDTTAITGTFLNSDDTALTTNIFLTDPRLFGVRVTKHFDGGTSGGLDFLNEIGDRSPQVWIQLGGNLAQFMDGWQRYDPSFLSQTPSGLPSLSELEKKPTLGVDWEGKLSIQPKDSDWVLKAGVRFGRSSVNKTLHQEQAGPTQTIPATAKYCLFGHGTAGPCSAVLPPKYNEVADGEVKSNEEHVLLDFTLGKDVGLGSFGNGTIGAGVRMARFDTNVDADLRLQPPHFYAGTVGFFATNFVRTSHLFEGVAHDNRSYHGIGPEVTWDAEQPMWGDEESGELTVDWGVNAAILFGRKKVTLDHSASDLHCVYHIPGAAGDGCPDIASTEVISRSHSVVVPNVGGYLGASVRYRNSKISFGYRADTFFNAIDGGQESAADYNRGFYGPYLNVSLGF